MSTGGKGGEADAGPMLEYANKALNLQKTIYDQSKRDAQPWYQGGSGAVQKLSGLLGIGPSDRDYYKSLVGQYQSGGASGDNQQRRYYFTDPVTGGITTRETGTRDQRLDANYLFDTNLGYNIDTEGLQAAVDKAKAEREANQTDGFGDLLKSFSKEDYQEDPGYQFRLEQGQKALERGLNSRGKNYSPEALKALTDYNSGMASQEYGNAYNRFNIDNENIFNRLATLSGFGQTASQQLQNAGTQYANAGTDLYTGMGNAITAANQAKAANKSSMFNTLAQVGGQLGSAYLMSDARSKENIEHIGYEKNIPIYHFNYLGDDTTYKGVMAQDILRINPDAVVLGGDGYLRVNYDILGVKMEVVNAP